MGLFINCWDSYGYWVVRPEVEPEVVPWPRVPEVVRCRPVVVELPLVPFLRRRVPVVVASLVGLAGLMVFVSSVTVPAVVLVGGMMGGGPVVPTVVVPTVVPAVVPRVVPPAVVPMVVPAVVPAVVVWVPAVVWACAVAPASSSATRMSDVFMMRLSR